MWAVVTLAFVVGGIWSVVSLRHHAPDQGILALLFEVFLTFAALYWFDFRRTSTGVVTAIRAVVGAAVFPVGLLCHYLVPAAQIPPGLWNVSKYFVAFGMILTLLEDEFLALQGGQWSITGCSSRPTPIPCGCTIRRPSASSRSTMPR